MSRPLHLWSADRLLVCVPADVDDAVLDAVAAAATDATGVDAVLEALTADGLAATPPFLLAAVEPDGVRIVVRGDLEAVARGADGTAAALGAGRAATWRDDVVADVVAVEVGAALGTLTWRPAVSAADGAPAPVAAPPLAPAGPPPSGLDASTLSEPESSMPADEPPDPAPEPRPPPPPPVRSDAAAPAEAWPPPTPVAEPWAPPAPTPPPVAPTPPAPPAPTAPPPAAHPWPEPAAPPPPGAPAPRPDAAPAPGLDFSGLLTSTSALVGGVAAAPASAVPGAGMQGRSGRTIDLDELRRRSDDDGTVDGPGGGARPGPGQVRSVRCPAGHPSAPSEPRCRACGLAVVDPSVHLLDHPVVARLVFDSGLVVDVDRPQLIGRGPTPFPDADEAPNLVAVPGDGQDLSRDHVAVRLDGWDLLVEDLGSTNGTEVAPPGLDAVRLREHAPVPVAPGTEVTLAGVVRFRVEAPGQ